MAHNKGRPSGSNKSETPGLRDNSTRQPAEQNTDVSGNDASFDDKIPDNVREMNPNRNVDKTDATNAGGYKN